MHLTDTMLAHYHTHLPHETNPSKHSRVATSTHIHQQQHKSRARWSKPSNAPPPPRACKSSSPVYPTPLRIQGTTERRAGLHNETPCGTLGEGDLNASMQQVITRQGRLSAGRNHARTKVPTPPEPPPPRQQHRPRAPGHWRLLHGQ